MNDPIFNTPRASRSFLTKLFSATLSWWWQQSVNKWQYKSGLHQHTAQPLRRTLLSSRCDATITSTLVMAILSVCSRINYKEKQEKSPRWCKSKHLRWGESPTPGNERGSTRHLNLHFNVFIIYLFFIYIHSKANVFKQSQNYTDSWARQESHLVEWSATYHSNRINFDKVRKILPPALIRKQQQNTTYKACDKEKMIWNLLAVFYCECPTLTCAASALVTGLPRAPQGVIGFASGSGLCWSQEAASVKIK